MRKFLFMVLITIGIFQNGRAQLRLSAIAEKYTAYQNTWARTKLHLVLNQEKFSPGDTVFFKAYFLKEDLTRLRGKQLIEMHLVNDKGQSEVHLKFHVHNGLGFNQLVIPNTLRAGIYYITAYNNWMRNFDPDYFFKKQITVVNKKVVDEVEEKFLRIAVEGGKLIAGILNKLIVFNDKAGSIIQIKDHTGQEVKRVTTGQSGMAFLHFTPVEGTRYTAKTLDDSIYTVLPAVEPDGVGLQLMEGSNKDITLIMASPQSSLYRGKELFLMITYCDKILYSTTGIHQGQDSIQIQTSGYPEGIIKISLLDPAGKVLAARDFFHHRDELVVSLQPDQPTYATRQKVRLELSITDQAGKPLEGEFSFRAINKGLFEMPALTLWDELILNELKLPYFRNVTRDNIQQDLDNLLIIGTQPLPWTAILSGQSTSPSYAYSNVIEKKGKAFDGNTNQPLLDYTQILFYLQNDQTYYQTFTMDKGSISLTLQDFYGEDEFFYMAKIRYGEEINNVNVIWESDSIPLPVAPHSIEKDSADRYASFIERKKLIDQSFEVHAEGRAVTVDPIINLRDDLPEADITVNLADYVVFPTMHDVIKEVVSGMYSRKSNKGDIVRVNLITPLIGSSDPVYIIDGYATKNTDYFLSLKPSDLKTLKVVNSTQKLIPTGLLGQFGIVMIESKSGDLREPLTTENKRVTGLQFPAMFKGVDVSRMNPHIPDFRSTVYWNPSMKTDNNGKAIIEFNVSDDVGNINVMIDGITNGLQPFSATTDFKVEIKKSSQ